MAFGDGQINGAPLSPSPVSTDSLPDRLAQRGTPDLQPAPAASVIPNMAAQIQGSPLSNIDISTGSIFDRFNAGA